MTPLIRVLLLAGVMLTLIAIQTASAQQDSRYECLSGTIDRYPVVLHVHQAGPSVFGYYYYTARQQPVYFSGDDTTYPGKLKLYVFGKMGEAGDEVFLLSREGTGYSGEWKQGDGAKTLAVQLAPVTTTGLVPFELVYTSGSTPLIEGLAGSPEASFFAAAVWPKGSGPAVPYLKNVVRKAFEENPGTSDIGQVFLAQKAGFFEEYRSAHKGEQVEELLENTYAYTEDMMAKLMVVYHSPKLLTLARFDYMYSGGAHGNYATDYFSLNLEKQQRIGLNEILNSAGKQRLPMLLNKYFRKTYGVKETESLTEFGLFENTIEPNENYFITGKGIGFSYAPYEIGPYAIGEIIIFIPFTELQAYLQPGIKTMLQ